MRALVPRFRLWNMVLAWRCSFCGTLFSLTVEEAEQLRATEPPPHVRKAFQAHSCGLALGLLAERLQQARITHLGADPEKKTSG